MFKKDNLTANIVTNCAIGVLGALVGCIVTDVSWRRAIKKSSEDLKERVKKEVEDLMIDYDTFLEISKKISYEDYLKIKERIS